MAVEEEEVVEVEAVLLTVLFGRPHFLEILVAAEEDTLAWPRPPPGWSIPHSHQLLRHFPSHASLLPIGLKGCVGASEWVTKLRIMAMLEAERHL